MSLPVNIEDLLAGTIVEGERMEFKQGWNPGSVMRTVCAFANDFENLGSGYVIVGVEEEDGKPKRPVLGFSPDQFEKVQKEMVGYANLMRPPYFPRLFLEPVDGKNVLVIWVPAGSHRPYEVPREIGAKDKEFAYYIRQYSSSVMANREQKQELINLTSNVPYDDRVNHHATIDDIDFLKVRSFLKEVKSRLYEESAAMTPAEIYRQLNLVEGANEHLFPRHVALLMFGQETQKFFPYARIEVVEFPDGLDKAFIERPPYTGPVQHQLRNVLEYLKHYVIKEMVVKVSGKAEADRVFNYPYEVLEEALANAVYHRNYELTEPIEVRILRDKIEIISYGGPDPSIRMADFSRGILRSRRYRNRRIGEFLKELRLTEGRGTGIPTIKARLEENGSPAPFFDTDGEDRRYFLIEIPVHPAFLRLSRHQVETKLKEMANYIDLQSIAAVLREILASEWKPYKEEIQTKLETKLEKRVQRLIGIMNIPMKRAKLLSSMCLANNTINYEKYITPLLEAGWIEMTIPSKPTSGKQQYKLTSQGEKIKSILYD
ncbi:MAG: RNA-binding domain-containing protein [Flavisolibacter sp.]